MCFGLFLSQQKGQRVMDHSQGVWVGWFRGSAESSGPGCGSAPSGRDRRDDCCGICGGQLENLLTNFSPVTFFHLIWPTLLPTETCVPCIQKHVLNELVGRGWGILLQEHWGLNLGPFGQESNTLTTTLPCDKNTCNKTRRRLDGNGFKF